MHNVVSLQSVFNTLLDHNYNLFIELKRVYKSIKVVLLIVVFRMVTY